MSVNKNPDIVAIGHLCMDRIFLCEHMPQENTSAHIVSHSQQPGGTACQAIVAASRLGASTGYMSPLGDDDAGRELYAGCVKEGIDMRLCRVDKGMSSHFTNVIVNLERDTRTFFSYHSPFAPLEFNDAEREYIKNAKIIHLDNTRNDNALAAARLARENGVLVSLDASSLSPDSEKNWELAALADIIIAADKYPRRMTGLSDPREAILAVARRISARIFIVTNGGEGCILYKDGELIPYPSYAVTPIDTTGAGDAFHGAFLFGMLKGFDLDYNIRFSSAVAAQNCLAVGGRAGLPGYAQTLEFMRNNSFSGAN